MTTCFRCPALGLAFLGCQWLHVSPSALVVVKRKLRMRFFFHNSQPLCPGLVSSPPARCMKSLDSLGLWWGTSSSRSMRCHSAEIQTRQGEQLALRHKVLPKDSGRILRKYSACIARFAEGCAQFLVWSKVLLEVLAGALPVSGRVATREMGVELANPKSIW